MRNRARVATAVALLLCSASVHGQQAGESPPPCRLDLSTQSLDAALGEIGRQCGVQIFYFSGITAGKTAPPLRGEFAIDQALRRLLEGTGLTFRQVNAQTFELRPAAGVAATNDADERASVAAQARSDTDLPEVIINGTAEGLVATRIETPLRDIPQTLTVISAEQIRQQNTFDLNTALERTPGVIARREDSLFQEVYSRGFQVTSYTLDGGGSLRPFTELMFGSILLLPNLSGFEHIEVLRGSNALFGADATAGGAINLVRKRPLREPTFRVSSAAGSWNHYRQEIDLSGPIALDGALRGRLDVSHSQRDYFYDDAHQERRSLFGVLDFDLTQNTVLTIGGSYSRDRARPFEGGLPLFNDGTDPQLPRSTAYTFDWSRFNTRVGETYLRVAHDLGNDWRLKVNATLLDARADFSYALFLRPINPATRGMPLIRPIAHYSIGPAEQKQYNMDATLTGVAEWRGRRVELAFGGDFRRSDSSSLRGETGFGAPLADAYAFDPAAYPNPLVTTPAQPDVGEDSQQILSGLYTSLRIEITQPWSVTAGLRVSNDRIDDTTVFYFGQVQFDDPAEYEYDDVVTPYFATQFEIDGTWSVYASYADVFLTNIGFLRSEDDLLPPSHGVNMEVGLKGAWRNGTLNGSLALYRIRHRGVALEDPENPPVTSRCCWTSGGRNISEGADLELHGHLTSRWVIGAGYTFNQSEQVYPGQTVATPYSQLSPRHLLRLWTSYRLPGAASRWTLGGSLHAQSNVYNDTRQCPVVNARFFCVSGFQNFRNRQSGFAIVSPRIAYQITDRWQAALNINNAFDKRYYEQLGSISGGNWFGEPRSFLVRVDGRL